MMMCNKCGGPTIGDNIVCDNCRNSNDNLPDPDGWDEIEFNPCSMCDGHDACEDFGCAIELGLFKQLVKG